jgi:carbohydrate kinase (thermoresistant glucokinase family)
VIREDIKKIYCLVRASSPANARLRVTRSLRERSVYNHIPLNARKKIDTLPSNFGEASLGLSPETYSQIASNITGLVHCAWSVNFNLGLGSFEADCIAGTHNLLTLCLKAQRPEPATFNFCSSVSTVARTKGGFVPESLPESLEYAQEMGYAQSKLVTEHICIKAAKLYGIKTHVLRIGQVIADTIHGIWNATEAIPLIMQAALTIGAVPALDDSPLWLPVDIVASTVSEISLGSAGAGVMNIVNHQSFHWTRELLPALHRAGLDFKELSPREWIDALRKSNPDPVANPPIKLVEFFASKYDNDLPRTGVTYETSYARSLSPSLAAAPVLDQSLVDKFVSHFLATSWATGEALLPKKRLIVISGPPGAGTSSIAKGISQAYDIVWIDGDHLHPKRSIQMTANSTPDEELRLLLEAIDAAVVLELRKDEVKDIIVTYPELQRSHRDELRKNREVQTVFFVLQGSPGISGQRIGEPGSVFKDAKTAETKLDSELPGVDETDVIPLDATGDQDEVLVEVLDVLKGT